MKVQPIGHLHFKVSSRSRKGVEHLVDLAPQDGKPYWCSCEKFTMHPAHFSKPCHHLEAALAFLQRQLKARTDA